MLGNNYNVAYDEDVLNSSIRKVFLWMIVGLSLTIGTMFAVVGNESLASFVFSSWRILIFAELGLVIALSAAIRKISSAVAGIMFLLYSVMTGLTLSFTLFLYDYMVIILAFSTTVIIFVVMALFGYFTKENLMSFGRMLMVGLISLVVVSIINIFLKSPSLYWIISYAGVVIFTALIGYDMQKIKLSLINNSHGDTETLSKISILGALELYLDFVNLFLSLLRIFGKKR